MNIKIDRRNMFYGAELKTFEAAKILRKNMTLAERILWKQLRDKKMLKVKFRRQHPVEVFIVDFYCHELKLAIEVDGDIHLNKERSEYDLGRTAELYKFGITILRFTNYQVIYDIDHVIKIILKKISELAPL